MGSGRATQQLRHGLLDALRLRLLDMLGHYPLDAHFHPPQPLLQVWPQDLVGATRDGPHPIPYVVPGADAPLDLRRVAVRRKDVLQVGGGHEWIDEPELLDDVAGRVSGDRLELALAAIGVARPHDP
jgi:hypothetical protein